MSLSAIAWLVIYVAGMAASFTHPLFGLLAYLFEYYLRPTENWWGREIPIGRTSLIAAVVVGVTFILHRGSLRPMAAARNLALPWAILMGLNVLLVSTWAVDSDLNYRWATTLFSHLTMYGLIIGVVRSRDVFDVFGAAHIVGGAWWGWNSMGARRQAGRLEGVGSSDTKAANPGASHVLTIIPLLFAYIFGPSTDRRLRLLALVAVPLVINLFVLYNSRGGVVGLVVAACATVVVVKGTTRFKMIAAAIAAGSLIIALADPQFISRQQTTASASEDDSSAQSRISTWKASMKFFADHPLGTGGRGFHVLSPLYIPEIVDRHRGEGRSAHNTYIQVTAEWGLQGLFFYLGFVTSSLLMLRRIRARGTTASPWFYRALAIEAALIGMMVSAVFGDRFYTESVYWLCALSFAAYRSFETDEAEATSAVKATPPQPTTIVASFPPRLANATIRERLARHTDDH